MYQMIIQIGGCCLWVLLGSLPWVSDGQVLRLVSSISQHFLSFPFLCTQHTRIANCRIGMNTSWFIGPIAKRIGGGGDVGFELAFGFAVTTFIPLRYFEKKYWGH